MSASSASPQMMTIHGNNSGGSQSSSGHTPNHNCDSNLSTTSAGSHNSDKEMSELTPEKCRNQSSGADGRQTQPMERKRRKKDSTNSEDRQQPNGDYLKTFAHLMCCSTEKCLKILSEI